MLPERKLILDVGVRLPRVTMGESFVGIKVEAAVTDKGGEGELARDHTDNADETKNMYSGSGLVSNFGCKLPTGPCLEDKQKSEFYFSVSSDCCPPPVDLRAAC
jgi:hypothetical protein